MRETLGEEPVRGVLTTVETEIKYSGYIAQQERQIERLKDAERRPIPGDFRFRGIPGLVARDSARSWSGCGRRRWAKRRVFPGVTPAAVAILDVYLSLDHVH